MNCQIIIYFVLSFVMMALAYPRFYQGTGDLEPAASAHGHYGRVQIKVYRGPTTHGGHEHFAPHGFWVKQPADDGHH